MSETVDEPKGRSDVEQGQRNDGSHTIPEGKSLHDESFPFPLTSPIAAVAIKNDDYLSVFARIALAQREALLRQEEIIADRLLR